MLETMAEMNEYLSARFDLASINFYLSWAGALAALVLMVIVGEKRTIRTWVGFLRWTQTCALFWLVVALVINGSYPVQNESQPWLPTVFLSGMIAFAMMVTTALYVVGGQRTLGKEA